jgi:tetratricopeptide (TPR) repeat protein
MKSPKLEKKDAASLGSVDSWDANRAIIKAAEASGNLGVALATTKSELKARPDNKEARLLLARLQTRANDPEQALLTLKPLLHNPEPAALVEQGRAQLALNHVPEAQKLLEKALKAAHDKAMKREARKLLAVVLDLSNEHAKAQGIYQDLLVEEDEPAVRFNYGRSCLASGHYDQAVSALLPLVDMRDMPQARVLAAAAMVNKHDLRGARNLLEGYMRSEDIDRVLEEAQQ